MRFYAGERDRMDALGARDAPTAMSYAGLLRRYRGYRYLWSGEVASLLGDWFNTIALYTAVQQLTDDPRAVAGVIVAKMLPPFLVIPVAGPLVDRMERRGLLIATDVFRLLAILAMVVGYRAESLATLYSFTVLSMAASGIAKPAKDAALPLLIPRHHIPTANALGGGTWSVMLTLGASLGGVAVAWLGVELSFGLDAATFALSALLFSRMPRLDPPSRAPDDNGGFREGILHLAARPYILALTFVKSGIGLFGIVEVLIPFYGTTAFPATGGPLVVGFLYAMRGLGALCGALVPRHLMGDQPWTMRRAIVVGFGWAALSAWGLSMATNIWWAGAALFFLAVGTCSVWVFSSTLLQLEADPRFHGRIFTLEFGSVTLVSAACSWIAGGALARGMSLSDLAQIGVLSGVVPAVVWALLLVARSHGRRQMKRRR